MIVCLLSIHLLFHLTSTKIPCRCHPMQREKEGGMYNYNVDTVGC